MVICVILIIVKYDLHFLFIHNITKASMISGKIKHQMVQPIIIPVPLLPKFILCMLTPRKIVTTKYFYIIEKNVSKKMLNQKTKHIL
jgi:hypothetical protein